MHNIDVSVIVLTFNPDKKKLMTTIDSIIKQEKINYEIIVSDDASEVDFQDLIKKRFESCGVIRYKLIKSEVNRGTVKNYMDALRIAKGKYSYGISPGDFLYDKNVLYDFCKYCDTNDLDITFGNAFYYCLENGDKPTILNGKYNPMRPNLYKVKSVFRQKIAFLFGNYILGATYFRRTDIAQKYTERILSIVKYAEDTPGALFALADGIEIRYFDRDMIWYEYGVGISTKKASKWDVILNKEYEQTYRSLKKIYPNDSVIDAACIAKFAKSKKMGILLRCLKHPYISMVALLQKTAVKRKDNNMDKRQISLIELFNNTGE